MNKLELLKKLHCDEKDLFDLYTKLAEEVPNVYKPIIYDIAKDEKDHMETLADMIKDYECYYGETEIELDWNEENNNDTSITETEANNDKNENDNEQNNHNSMDNSNNSAIITEPAVKTSIIKSAI